MRFTYWTNAIVDGCHVEEINGFLHLVCHVSIRIHRNADHLVARLGVPVPVIIYEAMQGSKNDDDQ